MQLIRGLNRWQHQTQTVLTIGNFDGMHRGHQIMLEATRAAAKQAAVPAAVVSFEPLPHEYFSPDNAPPRLQGLRDRFFSMRQEGIDMLVLLDFDPALASLSAEDFIKQVLVDKFKARHLVIGDDFRFGHKRKGDYQLLQKFADQYHYSLQQSSTCEHNQERISSSAVRNHLSAGNLDDATSLLGRAYRISGRVVHGEKVGRQLGFPTANVALGPHRPPLRGVFAVWATHLQSAQRYAAVANLGERPTVGGRKLLLEVHALDSNVQWYGEHLAVDFIAQLRSEKRFDSLDALKAQIACDAEQARALMRHR
jgi:riboflavin kinase/FMN adenylyltransferase